MVMVLGAEFRASRAQGIPLETFLNVTEYCNVWIVVGIVLTQIKIVDGLEAHIGEGTG